MYILIVEKRISAEVGNRGKSVEDWYVLMAVALPFAPWPGFKYQLKPQVYATLQDIVYTPDDGTFWGQTEPVLHPKPNAQKVAEELVDKNGWDVAMEESTLADAKVVLQKKAIAKLQQTLIQAQIKMAGGAALLSGQPRSKRRH